MPVPKTERKNIIITQLIVNPDNLRFIEAVGNEEDAIINMFNQKQASLEMYNLAADIAENALNPFETPIVWLNPETKKYSVIEGNRRITCIKLMTQYKNNKTILSATSDYVSDIYKLDYKHGKHIECIVYEDPRTNFKPLGHVALCSELVYQTFRNS